MVRSGEVTGKRIGRLSAGRPGNRFNFSDIRERFSVDRGRLYGEFARDLAVLSLPMLLAVGSPIGYVVAFALDVVGFPFLTLLGGGCWRSVSRCSSGRRTAIPRASSR